MPKASAGGLKRNGLLQRTSCPTGTRPDAQSVHSPEQVQSCVHPSRQARAVLDSPPQSGCAPAALTLDPTGPSLGLEQALLLGRQTFLSTPGLEARPLPPSAAFVTLTFQCFQQFGKFAPRSSLTPIVRGHLVLAQFCHRGERIRFIRKSLSTQVSSAQIECWVSRQVAHLLLYWNLGCIATKANGTGGQYERCRPHRHESDRT